MKEEARVNPLGCVSWHQANQTRQEHVHPHGSFSLEEARKEAVEEVMQVPHGKVKPKPR